MGVNKVEYYGETLIDTTGTTVSEETLMEGETAINAAGEVITGNLRPVKYTAQSPTAAEQAQARKNIDALGTDDLPEAINTALAQAKESGEFDGKDGQDGQPGQPGQDGQPGKDGRDGQDGKDGKSAYEQAQDGGFTGTEEEFGDMLYNCVTANHGHRWNQITDRPFGEFPTEEGTDTVTSDDVIYGNFHRVSEFVPTMNDLRNGGTITYYRVSGGAITGGLQTINFPQGDYTIKDTNNGIMINSDGVPMVLISYNGKPQFGAITFSDITEPGVYFDQGDLGKCIHSLKINSYDGFKFYETRPIPEKYLPEDIGSVKTVNNIAPDENGNINIEVGGESSGGGSSKVDSAFNLIKSDTLAWNGDTTGKIVVKDAAYEKFAYIHVSDAVPTLTELQEGFKVVWDSGMAYECVASDVKESGNCIRVDNTTGFVAKEDGADYAEDGFTLHFPKKGTYLLSYNDDGEEDFVSELAINNYDGFTKPVLKMENLTPHGHDWYGKAVDKGNTVRGDDIIHGGFVKVSDAVPTLAEVQKGGTIRFYNVVDNEISGDLIVMNYLERPYSVVSGSSGILIANDGVADVQIKNDGVYFRQDKYYCVHSLTINDYEGFEYNVEKIPAELIPEGVGGASSWNDLTDKPFYETTVMGDTLTWDGDMTGRVSIELEMPIDDEGNTATMYFVNVSDSVPTVENLQNGGSFNSAGQVVVFPYDENLEISVDYTDIGSVIMIDQYILIAKEDNADLSDMLGIILPKKGVYLVTIPAMGVGIDSLTINNYTGFEMTEIKPLDTKFLPESHQFGETTVMGDTLTWDGDMTGKVYAEMEMPIDEEGNTTTAYFVKVSDAIPTFEEVQSGGTATAFNGGQSMTFEFGDGLDCYYTDMGSVLLDETMQLPMIAKEDNVDVMGMFTLPEKGFYMMYVPAMGMYVGSFTINNYDGFETTEVKTIDSKYLPSGAGGVNATFTVESSGIGVSGDATVTCDKSLTELMPLSLEELYNVNIIWVVEGSPVCLAKPITVTKMAEYNTVMFGFTITAQGRGSHYFIAFDDGEPIVESIMAS